MRQGVEAEGTRLQAAPAKFEIVSISHTIGFCFYPMNWSCCICKIPIGTSGWKAVNITRTSRKLTATHYLHLCRHEKHDAAHGESIVLIALAIWYVCNGVIFKIIITIYGGFYTRIHNVEINWSSLGEYSAEKYMCYSPDGRIILMAGDDDR